MSTFESTKTTPVNLTLKQVYYLQLGVNDELVRVQKVLDSKKTSVSVKASAARLKDTYSELKTILKEAELTVQGRI